MSASLMNQSESMSEKDVEEKASWLDRISRLNEEICVIERELEEHKQKPLDTSDQGIRDILQQLESQEEVSASGALPPDDGDDEQETVDQLKRREGLLAAMTGIRFTSVSCRTLEEDESSASRQHEVAGSSHGLQFKVQFVVNEREAVRDTCSANLLPQLSVDDASRPFIQAEIQELRVEVDRSIEKHLRSFVGRVEEDNALLRFFQVYTAFTASCEERDRLFHSLQAKHAGVIDIVSSDDDLPILVIQIPPGNGVTFKLHWIPDILRATNEVHPRVHLQCTTPEDATLSQEDRLLLEGIPEQLHLLMRELGTESAIRTVFSKLF